jgi:hypothetical protein
MDELKSAFDRAMERVEQVGKLSPEEMRERKEAEFTPAGRAIAERYLEHGHEQLCGEEIGKHGGEEGAIVKRAALVRLVESIDLTSYDKAERAMKGVLALASGGDDQVVNGIIEDMARLFKEFGEELQLRYNSEKESIEGEERELLHQLRISGGAVGDINMATSESWGRAYREFSAPFRERLEALKQDLVRAAVDNS